MTGRAVAGSLRSHRAQHQAPTLPTASKRNKDASVHRIVSTSKTICTNNCETWKITEVLIKKLDRFHIFQKDHPEPLQRPFQQHLAGHQNPSRFKFFMLSIFHNWNMQFVVHKGLGKEDGHLVIFSFIQGTCDLPSQTGQRLSNPGGSGCMDILHTLDRNCL